MGNYSQLQLKVELIGSAFDYQELHSFERALDPYYNALHI